MPARFVTASGTGLGKTLVTTALAWQLRRRGRDVRALKPVISGFAPDSADESDSGLILASLGRPATLAAIAGISPWRFAAPLSPDMAAAREGTEIDLDRLVAFCRAAIAEAEAEGRVLLIEGVGGAMVPLGGRTTVADWIAALAVPAILVVGSYLGSLSHALTAAEALDRRGVAIAGIAVSESADSPVPLADAVATLDRFLAPVAVVPIPRLAPGPRPWEAAPGLLRLLNPLGRERT